MFAFEDPDEVADDDQQRQDKRQQPQQGGRESQRKGIQNWRFAFGRGEDTQARLKVGKGKVDVLLAFLGDRDGRDGCVGLPFFYGGQLILDCFHTLPLVGALELGGDRPP